MGNIPNPENDSLPVDEIDKVLDEYEKIYEREVREITARLDEFYDEVMAELMYGESYNGS